jgi:hypothetical protein
VAPSDQHADENPLFHAPPAITLLGLLFHRRVSRETPASRTLGRAGFRGQFTREMD